MSYAQTLAENRKHQEEKGGFFTICVPKEIPTNCNYGGTSTVYIGKEEKTVNIYKIDNWSDVVVPYYSWNGCGGVYMFHVTPDYIDIGYFTGYIGRLTLSENRKHFNFETQNDKVGDDLEQFSRIVMGDEMIAIRRRVKEVYHVVPNKCFNMYHDGIEGDKEEFIDSLCKYCFYNRFLHLYQSFKYDIERCEKNTNIKRRIDKEKKRMADIEKDAEDERERLRLEREKERKERIRMRKEALALIHNIPYDVRKTIGKREISELWMAKDSKKVDRVDSDSE